MYETTHADRTQIIEAIEDFTGHGVIDSTFTTTSGRNTNVWVTLDRAASWAEKTLHVDYQPGNGWVVIGLA